MFVGKLYNLRSIQKCLVFVCAKLWNKEKNLSEVFLDIDTNRLADRYRYRNSIDIGREIYVYRSIDTDTGAYTGI